MHSKKRAKNQKKCAGKSTMKYELSEGDLSLGSSDDMVALVGVVAGLAHPPSQI